MEVELFEEFFAPSCNDVFDNLVAGYKLSRSKIDQIADMVTGEIGGAVQYFIDGYFDGRERQYASVKVGDLFDRAKAVGALNSAYWSKAIQQTDVINIMPEKRRNQWHEQIEMRQCPEFDEDTVRNTIGSLMQMRAQFFAERVDGIFRSLSGEHVTNSPMGFRKRMIIAGVINGFGLVEHRRSGVINDLRCVIAKFMGTEEPDYCSSDYIVRSLRERYGEWVNVDGGAFRIRLYKKGTAHLEVHPDMAWRLNRVLASLYPTAIPSEMRERPKRKSKTVELIQRTIPAVVRNTIAAFYEAKIIVKDDTRRRTAHHIVGNTYVMAARDKHVQREVTQIVAAIGGVLVDEQKCWYEFEYNPINVLHEIIASGVVPDKSSHQFYPTPSGLAQQVIELAEISDGHQCLEPSAGIGGLAELLPKENTLCVEVSSLRCKVLESKGLKSVCRDFLSLSLDIGYFDRVVMNPPFDRGQWKAHLDHALSFVGHGGRLVSILPAGAPNSANIPASFNATWYGPFDNQFAGASVSVVILVADRKK